MKIYLFVINYDVILETILDWDVVMCLFDIVYILDKLLKYHLISHLLLLSFWKVFFSWVFKKQLQKVEKMAVA